MELSRSILKRCHRKADAISQITLDDDCIVSDSKPDVVRIIHATGKIIIEETKVGNQTAWISGKMIFCVLYRSENEEQKMETLTGEIPFQEKLILEGIDDFDRVKTGWRLEDLSVGMIHSRKLTVRAVVDLYAVSTEILEQEITSGVCGEESQQKIQTLDVMSNVLHQKDMVRIHTESSLPASKPNINRILWYSAQCRGMEAVVKENGIMIQGECSLYVLYLGDENQMEWYTTVLPVKSEVSSESIRNDAILWMDWGNADTELVAHNDYDGENRVLDLDISMEITVCAWEEKQVPFLRDVYSLEKTLNTNTDKTTISEFNMKNIAKVRLGEQFKLEKNQERILQICSVHGDVEIESTRMVADGIMAEGVLVVHILYLTSDDMFPIAHVESAIPFEQLIEIHSIDDALCYELESGVEQLQVNLLDQLEYEIKGLLHIAAITWKEKEIEQIIEIEEEPLDAVMLENQPGIIGYRTKEGESLWEVAKKYHTTIDEICKTNNLSNDIIKDGEKILIVKKVVS